MELDTREKLMLKLLSQGKSDREIAPKVKLTHGTTRLYLHRLYKKIGVHNRAGAAAWWVTQSLKEGNGRAKSA